MGRFAGVELATWRDTSFGVRGLTAFGGPMSGKERGEIGPADESLAGPNAWNPGEATRQAPRAGRRHGDTGNGGNLGHAEKRVVALIESDGHLGGIDLV
jgi:hypothetical protein